MTELSFLIDLLLNHKLPKSTKDAISERIKKVEEDLTLAKVFSPAKPIGPVNTLTPIPIVGAPQCASTIAAMIRHGEIPPAAVAPVQPDIPLPPPVIAQTPQTAAAMQSRQAAIAASITGTVDKASGRPRKF